MDGGQSEGRVGWQGYKSGSGSGDEWRDKERGRPELGAMKTRGGTEGGLEWEAIGVM